jgi:hypothetical protein
MEEWRIKRCTCIIEITTIVVIGMFRQHFMKTKNLIIVIIFGLIGGLIMIFSDKFLRDRIFGINLIVWPLSFVMVISFALKIITKAENYTPTFFKSIGNAILISFISSFILGLYWTASTDTLKFIFADIFSSTMMVLPIGMIVSILIGFIFRK